MTATPLAATGERADLLDALGRHRFFLCQTVRGLTDEQAALRSTVSELCLGGLIKHVAATESVWIDFAQRGPAAMPSWTDESALAEHADGFRMLPGDTLVGLLTAYDEVAARTDEFVLTTPDLEASQPLPQAPWFEPGARRSVRRVVLHIIAETSQHAGHADILREAIDGARTMG
jgi:hypothetical protein